MNEPYKAEVECNGVKVEVAFDGFCFTVSSDEKFVFAASINDPAVSDRGNACLLLFSPDEIADRMEATLNEHQELCLIRDGIYAICNLARGHEGVNHRETLEDGSLWSAWKSITADDESNKAEEYVPPSERKQPGSD